MKKTNKNLMVLLVIAVFLSLGFVCAATNFGIKPSQCNKAANYISIDTAARYALSAGFNKNNAITIVAISWAESNRGNVYACLYNSGSKTWDRGILQINNYWHSEVSDARAFSPADAFIAGYNIWRTRGFGEWTTYKNGAYRSYISSATSAINRVMVCSLGTTRCNGNKVESCTNGLSWNLVQTCGYRSRCVSGRCAYYA